MEMLALAAAAAVLSLVPQAALAAEYKARDEVLVVANTIRPYANPTETYQYYKLPYCKPKEGQWDDHALGELLTGSRKVITDYHLYFGVDQSYAQLCKLEMTPEIAQKFKDAHFEMYVDDIQLQGQVGYLIQQGMTQVHYFLNTHLHFDIAYNDEGLDTKGENRTVYALLIFMQLVAANVSMSSSDPGLEYRYALSDENVAAHPEAIFTYSVTWHYRPDLNFDDRNVHEGEFNDDLELHWISVINSFILVMMLTAFLSIVMLRILKRDFSRYMDLETGDESGGAGGLEDDSGWKLVHADVFRMPTNLSLFCAFNGAGAQLFVMLMVVLVSSLLGIVKPNKRGGMMTAFIVLYALTASVGGYHSSRMYRQLGGQRWVWNILLSVFIIPGPLLIVFSFLNSVAIWNDSSAALPFGTIMIVLAIFMLVALPLTVIGGIAGRNTAGEFNAPCRTNKIPREIPTVPAYRSPAVLMLAAGCLPFSAVYIELHHIFAAIWGHSIYKLFGILFLSFVMLVFVTSFTTISLTYIQLSSEDHRWWWRSYLSGGVAGFFVLLYSIWYYKHATAMTGFFQAAFYFGYTGMMAYCFFVMLGFIGFRSSLLFVRKIYRTIKFRQKLNSNGQLKREEAQRLLYISLSLSLESRRHEGRAGTGGERGRRALGVPRVRAHDAASRAARAQQGRRQREHGELHGGAAADRAVPQVPGAERRRGLLARAQVQDARALGLGRFGRGCRAVRRARAAFRDIQEQRERQGLHPRRDGRAIGHPRREAGARGQHELPQLAQRHATAAADHGAVAELSGRAERRHARVRARGQEQYDQAQDGRVQAQEQLQAERADLDVATLGWVVCVIDYRLSPKVAFPEHLIDSKRAIAFLRKHARESPLLRDTDPEFIVVGGESAGGHLASLVALTASDKSLQPGFEHVDTSVRGCIDTYGVHDFKDRHGIYFYKDKGYSFVRFIEFVVMQKKLKEASDEYDQASPMSWVQASGQSDDDTIIPPFLVSHGAHDTLVPLKDSALFFENLVKYRQRTSSSRVPHGGVKDVFVEIPDAHHAFNYLVSPRALAHGEAVCAFLENLYEKTKHLPLGSSAGAATAEVAVAVSADNSAEDPLTSFSLAAERPAAAAVAVSRL